MKKVVLASLLALASAGPLAHYGFSQAAAAQPGGVTMSQEEYAAYNNAKTQTTPAAQATAWEAYLKAYPQSSVKADALQQMLFAYSQGTDTAKTLDAADRLLQVDPNNFYALVFETTLRNQAAVASTDETAKQTGLSSAADYARKGLAAPKPATMSDADWNNLKPKGYPVFYSAIGLDAFNRKDMPAAIAAYKSELTSVPLAQTTTPGAQLQDTYYLAQAYYASTPPDYLKCAYYASRATTYAPEPFKTQFSKLGPYCYRRFHGKDEGYDALVAAAKDNLDPPASLVVTPAPSPADIVSNLIATTPDLASLAISDKEYVLQNGKPADADKVFETIKGKSVEFPDVLVIAATADQLQVAVSEDAVQSGTADFTFAMKAPLTTVPAVKSKVTITGTYASYTQSPLMITMSDGAVVEKKKAPVKKAAPAARRPAARKK